jgi:hypothetical protein
MGTADERSAQPIQFAGSSLGDYRHVGAFLVRQKKNTKTCYRLFAPGSSRVREPTTCFRLSTEKASRSIARRRD